MAVSQSDLTNYLKKQGKKTTDKTDYTVLPTPVKPVALPTYKATQPTVKNNLIGRNRATALDFNRITIPKVTKPVASPIKTLNVPKQTTNAMKSYANDPVAKVLMAKDPTSLATWKSANGTAFNSLDSNLKSYINDTIASHQSKIAAKSNAASTLMAGGASLINSATFTNNNFTPQKVEHEARYTTQPVADQLAAATIKAHPVASTIGNLAGTLVGGGITDVAAHAGLAGLKLGAKAVTKTAGKEVATKALPIVLQKAGKEAAFGATSNALYGAALDVTQGKDGKTIAKDALLNAGIGGILGGALGGVAGKIASKKMVTLPTVKEKSAIPQSVIDRAEQIKLNKVETQADIPATALNRGQGEVLTNGVTNDIKKAETPSLTENKLSDKAATYKSRAESQTLNDIKGVLSVPYSDGRNLLAPVVKKLSNEVLTAGKVSKETANSLFDEAYDSGKIILDDFYNAHKGLKAEMRNLRLDISSGDRANIADFATFRKENFGNFTIAKQGEGITVDKAYQELSESYPDLFPETITAPSDQIRQISQVSKSITKMEKTLDEYYGLNATEYKKYARHHFDETISKLETNMGLVKRYETDKAAQLAENNKTISKMPMEQIKQIKIESKPLRAAYNKAVSQNLLTADDKGMLEKLLSGDIKPNDVPDGYNKNGILSVYNAKMALNDKLKPVFDYKQAVKKGQVKYGLVETGNKSDGMTQEAILNDRTELVDLAPEIQKGDRFTINNIGQTKDLDRNLETAAGNNPTLLKTLKNNISRPIYEGKAKYVKSVKEMTDSLYNDVVKKYGINKKSKESAAVQWLGEGQKQIKSELQEYTINDLKKDFPNKWADIANAEKWFRKEYDNYVQKINTKLEEIYPDPFDENGELIAGRRLVNRKDYFHHYMEIANTPGLRDILNNTSTDIDPKLVGLSEFTQPKSKFWGALQQRSGQGAYTEDAVGGFLQYLPTAEYKINIEPVLPQLRAVIRDIQDGTGESKNANQFIKWLTDYTNSLAGKTVPWDRAILTLTGEKGRKALSTLDRVSARMRANAVMGNVSSMISQVFNLPNVVAYVKNPKYLAQGYSDATAAIFGKGEGSALLEQSPFLNERYLSRNFRQFDKGMLSNVKNFTGYLLEVGDEAVAKGGWLAAYKQAISNGMEKSQAIEQADLLIRKSVAGRGIGELPLSQQAKVTKSFAPFTVEVRNTFNLLKEKIGEKDALGLMGFAVASWLLNEGRQQIDGNQTGLNPIGTTISNVENWDNSKSLWQNLGASLGNYGGDILSNYPVGGYVGQSVNSQLGTGSYGSIFGDKDPSRFGTGNIAVNTLLKPFVQAGNKQNIDLATPAANLLLPFGGKQLLKTKTGLQNLGILPKVTLNTKTGVTVGKQDFAASYSTKNQLRFPIDAKSPLNVAKTLAGGSFATKEGKAYLQAGASPLTDKQTKLAELGNTLGVKPQTYLSLLQEVKKAKDSGTNAQRQIINNSSLTASQKAWFTRNNNLGDNVDYTDKDTLRLTTLYSDEVQEKAKTAKGYGINTKDFLTVNDNLQNVHSTNDIFGKPIYLSASRNKKAAIDKVPDLTKAQREFLYDMYDISEKVR